VADGGSGGALDGGGHELALAGIHTRIGLSWYHHRGLTVTETIGLVTEAIGLEYILEEMGSGCGGIKEKSRNTMDTHFDEFVIDLFGRHLDRIGGEGNRPLLCGLTLNLLHAVVGDHQKVLHGLESTEGAPCGGLGDAEFGLRGEESEIGEEVQVIHGLVGLGLGEARGIRIVENEDLTIVVSNLVHKEFSLLLMTIELTSLQFVREETILKGGEGLGDGRIVIQDGLGGQSTWWPTMEIEDDDHWITGLRGRGREGIIADLLTNRTEFKGGHALAERFLCLFVNHEFALNVSDNQTREIA
jgi:hypothetical protein